MENLKNGLENLRMEEKNKISHRGNALIELRKMLENM